MGANEAEQMKVLRDKINEFEKLNKNLVKEIKLLKRLEHHQGNKLVDISDPDQLPSKLKQLSEQKNYAIERLVDLKAKYEFEKQEAEK